MSCRLSTLVPLLALCLSAAPAGSDEKASFYRGLNLNGPPVIIDGNQWEGMDAKSYECKDREFENQAVPLVPATDPERAKMIRSSRWGGNEVTLLGVARGAYSVYLYVWEDNDSETFDIAVNGKTVARQYKSGNAGHWEKLGPWRVTPQSGKIKLTSKGGAANFSGIEVWRGRHEASPVALTADETEYFERHVRPVLVKHCYECHSNDAAETQGNLFVDTRLGLRKGGFSGPAVVPGDVEGSLLIKAIRQRDPDLKMPPEAKLSDAEIAGLEKWVKMNAPDPRAGGIAASARSRPSIDWEQGRDFWSLRPVAKPMVPTVQAEDWPANEVDHFILARLESAGLQPASDADKRTLMRRATFDLIGLPPAPAEIDSFLADESPDAFAKVVDRLLASPRYGERWGRHWLDVVRYADTAGDNSDFPIPQMYKYRNWVIDAFDRDLPYDQFVREQLAGDLLGGDSTEERQARTIATGYIANARRFGSRVDDYPQHLTIEDTLDNLGRTFLATTLNCARCHNHKFDPISTDDYYSLYGIFHSTRYPWPGIELEQKQRDLVPLVAQEEVDRVLAARKEEQEKLDKEVRRLEKARKEAKDEERKKLDKEVEEAKKRSAQHANAALPFEQAYAVAEAATIEDVAVQLKGDPAKLGDVVPRKFLTVLNGASLSENDATSGRLALAGWIVAPSNPLTARVMANRIWLYHFGKGIVPTANDFGRQGKPPSHPELLDWLASRFVESGWSIKAMHRTIMLSRTYRMSSARAGSSMETGDSRRAGEVSPDSKQAGDASPLFQDPDGDLLSAFRRRRLDAEAIRDTLLLLGGNLDLSRGGPHPFPPQAEWKFTQHNPFKAVYETNRRSVYLMTQRIQRHPYLAIFDGADPSASTPQRQASTTPLQALYLLNDAFVHEQAKGLARRLLSEASDADGRLELAYRLAFGRSPDADERQIALSMAKQTGVELRKSGMGEDRLEFESWQALCRAILRLNEFVIVD